MKKIILFTLTTFFITSRFAMASPADPCTGPNVAKNSWFISINKDNNTTKENLLKTLDLIATGGFSVSMIIAYPEQLNKTFVISFDPSYYSIREQGEKVKNDTLKQLASIKGNGINCNGIVRAQ